MAKKARKKPSRRQVKAASAAGVTGDTDSPLLPSTSSSTMSMACTPGKTANLIAPLQRTTMAGSATPSSSKSTLDNLPTEILERILEPDYYGLSSFLSLKQVSSHFRKTIDGMMSHATVWQSMGRVRDSPKDNSVLLTFSRTPEKKRVAARASGRFVIADLAKLSELLRAANKSDEYMTHGGTGWLYHSKGPASEKFFGAFPWSAVHKLDIEICADLDGPPPKIFANFPFISEGIAKAHNLKELHLDNMPCNFINERMKDTLVKTLQHIHLNTVEHHRNETLDDIFEHLRFHLSKSSGILPTCEECASHPYLDLLKHVSKISVTSLDNIGVTENLEQLLKMTCGTVEELHITLMPHRAQIVQNPWTPVEVPTLTMERLKHFRLVMHDQIDAQSHPLLLQLVTPVLECANFSARSFDLLRLSSKTLMAQMPYLQLQLSSYVKSTNERIFSTVSNWSSLHTLQVIWDDSNPNHPPVPRVLDALFHKLKEAANVPIKNISIEHEMPLTCKEILPLVKTRKQLSAMGKAVPIRALYIGACDFDKRTVSLLTKLVRPSD